jgi:uncharacterized protein
MHQPEHTVGPKGGAAFMQHWVVRCLSIALLSGLLFLPVRIPLRVLVVAGVAILWTLLEARSLAPLGLRRHSVRSTLIWALGITVVLALLAELVMPLIEHILGMQRDFSGYGALEGNAGAALRLLAYALTSAAIGEEVLFRGFLLHQLEELLGEITIARWTAIAVSGAAFGIAHFIQGPFGMVTTGVYGMFFAWAWFRSGRNLWALIVAHALIDTVGIGRHYLGWLNS